MLARTQFFLPFVHVCVCDNTKVHSHCNYHFSMPNIKCSIINSSDFHPCSPRIHITQVRIVFLLFAKHLFDSYSPMLSLLHHLIVLAVIFSFVRLSDFRLRMLSVVFQIADCLPFCLHVNHFCIHLFPFVLSLVSLLLSLCLRL